MSGPGETEAERCRNLLIDVLTGANYPIHQAKDYVGRFERAVREQVAQDIEAMDEPDWHTGGTLGAEEMGWAWARDDAARIVRGGR